MNYKIDVFHLPGTNLKTIIEKFIGIDNQKYEINYFDISDSTNENSQKNNEIILFEEDNSYLDCFEVYDKILSKYTKKTASIILSNNKRIDNVVKWMRKGASDYLIINELKKKDFF